ncbi:SdpI family protein [Lentzea sp. DG1S-22]|uniref:SdpI family protein n=1 Tax=Lentzea sp. DG1S-22 TaxID=3108822 RepID=UPI002E75F013|nr:SdpI family protein [Lentzea sp. DG1S-22]WVH78917.1 SdpI family protein [Lentzea sp. DG1S-22]
MNIVLSVVLGVLGVALGAVGLLGLQGKLRRNRFVGVRTAAALRDEETFALANRVAGVPNIAAGVVAIVSGAMAFVMADLAITAGVIGLVGALTIAFAGGIVGSRAAEALPEPVKPKGCGGCACSGGGCSPLAGL